MYTCEDEQVYANKTKSRVNYEEFTKVGKQLNNMWQWLSNISGWAVWNLNLAAIYEYMSGNHKCFRNEVKVLQKISNSI